MSDEAFVRRYGTWAVVAGASEGLGAAWAEALAARGLNLVLFARRPEVLEATAAAIRSRHGMEVRAHAFDLAGDGFRLELERLAGSLEVGFGVFNAAHPARAWPSGSRARAPSSAVRDSSRPRSGADPRGSGRGMAPGARGLR